jgi:integrase
MARTRGGLTAKAVEKAKHPGTGTRPVRVGDRDGLCLQISPGNTKSWLFRFTFGGRAREMGLGPVGDPPRGITLAGAREAAAEARRLLRQGIDPIEHRHSERRREESERTKTAANTFRVVAGDMIDNRESGWRNVKHRQQWRNTLATYVYPFIGDMPVAEIGTEDVLRALRPIWTLKPETASRVRGRIERVLAYAKALRLRQGENPAVWRGHLAEALPSPRSITGKPPGHHPALAWQEMPLFMAELRCRDSMAARALGFAILTAARTGEVLGAQWREIDLDAAIWTVPSSRAKAKREHRVPLTPPAVAILKAVHPLASGNDSFVFPGQVRGRGLSQMALLMLIRRMNAIDPDRPEGDIRWRDRRIGEPITAHGFRSSFRDWCGEASEHPIEVAEMALAHVIKNKTEAAYARGDLFAKRRELMADWAAFCGAKAEPRPGVFPAEAA